MAEPALLIPAAHTGHWLLYAVPVVVVLVAVVAGAIRERREQEANDGGDADPGGSAGH